MKQKSAEILCIGTELLMGQVLNTNAQFLSRRLSALGVSQYHQTVVGDNAGRLEEAYRHFSTACNMDPTNAEYRAAFQRVQNARQTGGYRTAQTGGETCTACDVCQALWCADCCCECMGGDCIRCC